MKNKNKSVAQEGGVLRIREKGKKSKWPLRKILGLETSPRTWYAVGRPAQMPVSGMAGGRTEFEKDYEGTGE